MVIRPAQYEDVTAIADLIRRSVELYFPDFASADQTSFQAQSVSEPSHIESYINEGALFLAEQDKQIQGVGGVKLAGPLAWFGLGYVVEEGRGIGSALMESRFNWLAGQRDYWWCCSDSYLDNQRAANHLRRHGFQVTDLLRPSNPQFGMEMVLWARIFINN